VSEQHDPERSILEGTIRQLEIRAKSGLGYNMKPQRVAVLYRYLTMVLDQNRRAFMLLDMLDQENQADKEEAADSAPEERRRGWFKRQTSQS
jgi:hypothetical protein